MKRWAVVVRFRDDGRICRSTAPAEHAVRGTAIGWGNRTFAGSDAEGHGAVAIPTPIETREFNDADPPLWFAHILAPLRGTVPRSGATTGRHGIGRRAGGQSRMRLEPQGVVHPNIPAAPTGWIRACEPERPREPTDPGHPRPYLWSPGGRAGPF